MRHAHPDAYLAITAGSVFASASSITVGPLVVVLTLLVTVGWFARVPWRWVIVATVGPMPMVLMYGLTVGHLTALDVAVAALRAAVSVTGVLVSVAAVPGPRLLATPVRFLPSWAAIAVLVTYRSTIVLAARVLRVRRAVRLRGGLPAWVPGGSGTSESARRRIWTRVETVGSIGGSVLLGAIDLGARHGDALRLRGVPSRHLPARSVVKTPATRVLFALALVETAVAVAGRTLSR